MRYRNENYRERNFTEIPRNSLIKIFTNRLSTMFALLIINCVYTPVNYRTLLLYDITDPYLSLPNQTVANFVAHGGVNFSWLVLLLIDRSLMTVLFPIPQS